MIKRKTIYDAHRRYFSGHLHNHCRLSANILSSVSRELSEHPAPHRLDYNWPFHLIVYMNGKLISVFADGWDNSIDILPLKTTGKPYSASKERRFLTPKGTVNYILKKWGKLRNA